QQPQQQLLYRRLRTVPPKQAMRVAAQEELATREPATQQQPQEAREVVAKQQHRIRVKAGHAIREVRVVNTPEMVRARLPAAVGHELVFVAFQKIDVPADRAVESGIVPLLHAEVPKIEDLDL